ncbi:MAG: hypothetical protein HKN81_07050 [Gammaproteobacteria bacterium]|nr:hypothetical protein [Gammaproteobacteria bacterium]
MIIQEQLAGEQIDQMPDLAIVWRNLDVPVEALESPRIGRVEIPEFNKRSGGHWHEGFLIAAGPDLKQGVSLGHRDLTDVAPTILALFGLPTPDYMDGAAMKDAFTDESIAVSQQDSKGARFRAGTDVPPHPPAADSSRDIAARH